MVKGILVIRFTLLEITSFLRFAKQHSLNPISNNSINYRYFFRNKNSSINRSYYFFICESDFGTTKSIGEQTHPVRFFFFSLFCSPSHPPSRHPLSLPSFQALSKGTRFALFSFYPIVPRIPMRNRDSGDPRVRVANIFTNSSFKLRVPSTSLRSNNNSD